MPAGPPSDFQGRSGPCAWPATSLMSEGIPAFFLGQAFSSGCQGRRVGQLLRLCPRAANTSARQRDPAHPAHTRMRAASSAFSAGTMTRWCPAATGLSTAGKIPGTGRISSRRDPALPKRCLRSDAASSRPAVRPTTMAKSKADPRLGRVAGVRVDGESMLGQGNSGDLAAERTRSLTR